MYGTVFVLTQNLDLYQGMEQWHILKGLAKLHLRGDGGQYPDVGNLRVGEESTNCSKSETGGALDGRQWLVKFDQKFRLPMM